MNEFRSHGGLIDADLCVAAAVVLPGGLWHDVVLPTLFHHAVAPAQKHQRVLNDLSRTRLSCGRMIQLLPPPLSPVRMSSLFLSLPACRRSSLLTKVGGGRETNYMTPRKPGLLYNTQYSQVKMFLLFIHSITSTILKQCYYN